MYTLELMIYIFYNENQDYRIAISGYNFENTLKYLEVNEDIEFVVVNTGHKHDHKYTSAGLFWKELMRLNYIPKRARDDTEKYILNFEKAIEDIQLVAEYSLCFIFSCFSELLRNYANLM